MTGINSRHKLFHEKVSSESYSCPDFNLRFDLYCTLLFSGVNNLPAAKA